MQLELNQNKFIFTFFPLIFYSLFSLCITKNYVLHFIVLLIYVQKHDSNSQDSEPDVTQQMDKTGLPRPLNAFMHHTSFSQPLPTLAKI